MALAEHRRELRRKAACGLAAARLGEMILGARARVHHHVTAREETTERSAHERLGEIGEASDPFNGRDAAEPFALEPVQQLEQLIFPCDVTAGRRVVLIHI